MSILALTLRLGDHRYRRLEPTQHATSHQPSCHVLYGRRDKSPSVQQALIFLVSAGSPMPGRSRDPPWNGRQECSCSEQPVLHVQRSRPGFLHLPSSLCLRSVCSLPACPSSFESSSPAPAIASPARGPVIGPSGAGRQTVDFTFTFTPSSLGHLSSFCPFLTGLTVSAAGQLSCSLGLLVCLWLVSPSLVSPSLVSP